MSAHGYLPFVKQFLMNVKHAPNVLEIGVDRGVTFLTLATFLVRTRPKFAAIGVDVLVQESVNIMLHNLDRTADQQVYLVEMNSLAALPRLIDKSASFDVIMLDGDHNYYTVSRELELLERLIAPGGMLIVDDYYGRWSERDMFYAERDGYENVKIATQKVETAKHGVKSAVDEWLSTRPEWQLSTPMMGEPVVLQRQQS